MNAWSSVAPSNTSLAKEFYSEIRAHQTNVRDRMTLDHYMQSAIDSADPACDGYHKQLTMKSSTTPQALSGASTTNVIPVTFALELVHTNENYSTPITYGNILNYNIDQFALSVITNKTTLIASQAINANGTVQTYNCDASISLDGPAWFEIDGCYNSDFSLFWATTGISVISGGYHIIGIYTQMHAIIQSFIINNGVNVIFPAKRPAGLWDGVSEPRRSVILDGDITFRTQVVFNYIVTTQTFGGGSLPGNPANLSIVDDRSYTVTQQTSITGKRI